MAITVILIVLVMVTVHYTAADLDICCNRLNYAPSDTRLIPVSIGFCESLQLSGTKTLANTNATLYSLQYPVYYNGMDSVSFPLYPHIAAESHEYYYYYLYPGSTINLFACISSEHYAGVGNFYLIKGYNSYKNWPFTLDQGNFSIDRCSGQGNKLHQYAIEIEDYYFFLFKGDAIEAIGLQVDVKLHRTRYKTPDEGISDSCTISGDSSCSVALDLLTPGPILLIVTPDNVTTANWAQGVGLDVTCIPRVWIYASPCLFP